MPQLTMGNNRKSSALYKCAKCGQTRQAVTKAAVRRCNCGGALNPVRKILRAKAKDGRT
jgi:Flp pilus assembly protein TadD